MSNDQDLFGEIDKASKTESNPESHSHENDLDDILELTDVVREGKDPLELDADAPLLLDEEKLDLQETDVVEDSGTEEIPPVVPEEPEDAAALDEPAAEVDFSALESSDFEFEDTTPPEPVDPDPLPDESQEQLEDVLAGIEQETTPFEKPEDILAELEKDAPVTEAPEIEQAEERPFEHEEAGNIEEPLDFPTPMVDGEEDDEKPEEVSVAQEVPGISEERMKTLLAEVTGEAVDRSVREAFGQKTESVIQETLEKSVRETVSQVAETVVRETFSEVAEKIIGETVDKAVRETVSDVAEKVIREAIDALKESIATSEP